MTGQDRRASFGDPNSPSDSPHPYAQARRAPAAGPSTYHPPLPRNEQLRVIDDRLAELARELGPEEYDDAAESRRAAQSRNRHQPHGRLRGLTGANPFSSGRIPGRGSRLRAERRELVEERRQIMRAREEARERGEFVPDEQHRPQQFDRFYRRFDGDGSGPSGGIGA